MKKSRTFYNFFLSYIFIMLIPVITGVGIYYEIIKIVELEEKKSNLALLIKEKFVIDNALFEIDRMTMLISENPYVRKFALLNASPDGSFYYNLYVLVQHLAPYHEINKFINSFYIYFRNSDRIVTTKSSHSMPIFYENYFTYNNLSYDQWRDIFIKPSYNKKYLPVSKITVWPELSFNLLGCIQSFPRVYSEDPTIVIWAFIDARMIVTAMKNISTDCKVFIIDENDRVMMSIPFSESENNIDVDTLHLAEKEGFIDHVIKGRKVIVSYTSSSYSGWKYISFVPYSTVMKKTQFVRILMTAMGIAILFLGFLTAYLLAQGRTKPLKEIVKLVRERRPMANCSYTNEYDFIKKNVADIADMNQALKKEMKQQLPMLYAAFFERIFKGDYASEDEIYKVLSHLEIDVGQDFFLVVIARINIYDNSILKERLSSLFKSKAIIKSMVTRKFNDRIKVHDKAENEIILLMGFTVLESAEYRAMTYELLLEIYNKLYTEYNTHISFAAGSMYSQLSDVWHSYREARDSLDTIRLSKDFRINWYEERTESKYDYYYPLDLEERLMNNAKAGNKKEVDNILELVYRENIDNRILSADILRFLMNNMCCSIVKILKQEGLNENVDNTIILEKVKNLQYCESFNDAYKTFKDIYESICNTVDSLKKSHNKELINNIKEYIQLHYKESSLNLYGVANQFNMTEAYLSSFIKEQTGIRFSNLLHEVRMENACKLLSEKSMSINMIAENVGYGSVQAFSRAFKKTKGINPRDYRNYIKV